MDVTVYRDLNYGTLSHRQCHLNTALKRSTFNTSKTSLDLFIPREEKADQWPVISNLHDDDRPGATHFKFQEEQCPVLETQSVSNNYPALIVFIHGGGWRRGHTRNWQHFLSRFDSNLLVSLYSKYCNHYHNIGESFARKGYACAVVTYPLVAPPVRVVLVESVTSFVMSWGLFLVPSFLLHMLFSLAFYLAGVKSVIFSVSETSSWQFQLATSLLISQLLTKLLISLHSSNYVVPSLNGSEERPPHAAPGRIIWTFMAALVVALYASFILYLSIFVCTIPQLCLLASVDSICTQTLITGLQLWNWSTPGTDAADTVRDQLTSVASAIRWLQRLSQTNPGYYDPKRIVLCGHSAGGYIVSLLGLDSSYLTSVGVDCTHIKGVISISGIYDISSMNSSSTLRFFYLIPVFGENSREWQRASPINKINQRSKWKTKFLLVSSSWEPINMRDTDEFETRLLSAKFDCKRVRLKSKTHFTILNSFSSGKKPSLVEIACEKFIEELQ